MPKMAGSDTGMKKFAMIALIALAPMAVMADQAASTKCRGKLAKDAKLELIEDDALLAEIDEGGAKDALPLLAFTLERLYLEYGGRGRLTLADYEALGRIKGSIEAAVERAFARLVDEDVLLIVGPAIGDNALVATPLAEAARVPTLNWAGAERARGEWMFHLQVGSHEDESLVMARHLKRLGAERVAVVYDQSPIGTRHLKYLEDEGRIIGLEIN
mgnify:CR=1 FL=1